MSRPACAFLGLVLASGCATLPPHVTLPRAPGAGAPYPERAAYVKKYYPEAQESDHIFLHGGDRIYYPEDLSPAVDDDSPTAKAIRDHVAARGEVEKYAWIGTAGSVLTGGGLLLFTSSLGVLLLPIDDAQKTPLIFGVMGGGGVAMVAGLGVIGINALLSGDDATQALESADRAARTFPQSLSDRTGVHIDADGNIVDNNAALPPAPPPVPTQGTST